ncbi:protein rolling stone-like [Lineus longissimus]|uniref:protein rolling stone-like n=1 Tax=Lineus longissimus TaxID=88925 RepID=UPI002B4C85CE
MPLREEFRWRNFGLTHFRKDVFFSSQWYWPPIFFITYRFIVAGYIVGWLMYVAASFKEVQGQSFNLYAWPVYLTNWSYFVLSAHLLVALVVACIHTAEQGNHCCRREHVLEIEESDMTDRDYDDFTPNMTSTEAEDEEVLIRQPQSLPWYMKMSWILLNVSAVAAILVSIVYWGALYPQMSKASADIGFIIDFNLHAVNSIVILLEMFICAIPIRLMHFIYPMVYGFAYVVFSLIFWAYDNSRVIYPKVLDWNHPGITAIVIVVIAFVGLPLFQLFLYGLYRLRVCIFRAIYRQR